MTSRDDPMHVRYNGETICARPGSRLLDIVLDAGFDHRHICGGHGFCTSCRVEVVDGSENLSPVSALERERLGSRAGELRLACQTTVQGSASVRVPPPVVSRFSPFEDESDL